MRTLFNRKLWLIFVLGIASGFPLSMIGACMTGWLADVGLSRSAIGLFGIILSVYTVNFLWAPLVDHLALPLLNSLGHRKSWVVLCLSLLSGLGFTLSNLDPTAGLGLLATVSLAIAVVSATQDLAIDAYRITVIRKDEEHLIGFGAAMATCGWWTGFSLPSFVGFLIANAVGWNLVYTILSSSILVVLVLVLVLLQEPDRLPKTESNTISVTRLAFLDRTLIAAVHEFFKRNGYKFALALLAFILTFKLGEAFLGRMAIVFYKEVGFTNEDIGLYSKGMGLVINIVFAIIAAFITSKFGTVRGLMLAGIAMATTNLLFAWLATIGPNTTALVFVLIADGITTAISTVVFVSFITFFTDHVHAATQYGALASIGNSGRTVLAASSGFVIDSLGGDWVSFFIITSVMIIPPLALLAWIGSKIEVNRRS